MQIRINVEDRRTKGYKVNNSDYSNKIKHVVEKLSQRHEVVFNALSVFSNSFFSFSNQDDERYVWGRFYINGEKLKYLTESLNNNGNSFNMFSNSCVISWSDHVNYEILEKIVTQINRVWYFDDEATHQVTVSLSTMQFFHSGKKMSGMALDHRMASYFSGLKDNLRQYENDIQCLTQLSQSIESVFSVLDLFVGDDGHYMTNINITPAQLDKLTKNHKKMRAQMKNKRMLRYADTMWDGWDCYDINEMPQMIIAECRKKNGIMQRIASSMS